jgi:hypothetical protein
MSNIAIIEYGEITYRGSLPDKFQNSNMNVTGLRKSEGDWQSLNAKDIFAIEEITPEYNSATHKIDGFTDDIQIDKVVQTAIIREKTQEELDAEVVAVATEYIGLRSEAHVLIGDQLDMIYWDEINGTTIWKDYVTTIKKEFPKPV